MNAADMPMWNDLSAMKEHHDDLKAQIASLQATTEDCEKHP